MSENLTSQELMSLLQRVFHPRSSDRALAFLVDVPDAARTDHPSWQDRRAMVGQWVEALSAQRGALTYDVRLFFYQNVNQNNAELPPVAWLHQEGKYPRTVEELASLTQQPFAEIFAAQDMIVATTEFSATAPLKLAAKQHGFRAATMPGFSRAMIPALRLDYDLISRRVEYLKDLLDRSVRATLIFALQSGSTCELVLDLRHRMAHASTGLLREPGTAGNLPSGEAYIVPYEGELPNNPSQSAGELPVQLGDEVVIYRITQNRAIRVVSDGPAAKREAAHLQQEPAYGNLAELGLGVLGDLGLQPCGEILLDEKLGLHLAFGRSDHFGGQVGAKDFSSPAQVIHQDRVYVPAMQPLIHVRAVDLQLGDSQVQPLMRDGQYVVDF